MDKAAARTRLAARRDALSPAARRDAGDRILARLLALPELTAPRTVFTYVSMPAEADTRPLIDLLHDRATTVLVPRILSRTRMIAAPFRGWDTLRPGPLGIPAPIDTEPYPGSIEVAIVPGLGFSPRGDRLGYGAGYYDRWFADHPQTRRIAIAYDCQVDPGIIAEAHDIAMDRLVTELRAFSFTRPAP